MPDRLLITETRCFMAGTTNDPFDTDHRYIRASASGNFPLPRDRTVRIAPDATNSRYVSWRWTDSVSADEFTISGGPSGLGNATSHLVKI